MKSMGDNSIDMVLCDPPYLMNYRSNRRVVQDKFDFIEGDKNSDDNYIVISEYIKECYRLLKDDSAFYMFCSWHHIEFFKSEVEKYFKLKNILVWEKNNHGSGDLQAGYAPKYEFILYANKGRCKFRHGRHDDILNFNKVRSSDLSHPTEKPVNLCEFLIYNSTDEGATVLDGFMGSGTTGVACKHLNRKFIGCEIDKHYFDIAKNRIEV